MTTFNTPPRIALIIGMALAFSEAVEASAYSNCVASCPPGGIFNNQSFYCLASCLQQYGAKAPTSGNKTSTPDDKTMNGETKSDNKTSVQVHEQEPMPAPRMPMPPMSHGGHK